MHSQYKRLSIEFPTDEYIHLKMACAKKGVSLKDFVTDAVIVHIEEFENELAVAAMQEALTEENLNNAISLDQLKEELGFKKQA